MSVKRIHLDSETRQKIFNYFIDNFNISLMDGDFNELEILLADNNPVIPERLNRESIEEIEDEFTGGTGGSRD